MPQQRKCHQRRGSSHENHYISLLVPCVDIPVSLGSLFQWVAAIDDRFYLSRLNQLF